MAVAEKEVLRPAVALRVVNNQALSLEAVLDGAKGDAPSAGDKPQWKFVKLFGVGNPLKFKDGSKFSFRLIKRNDGGGYLPSSEVRTADPVLAENLREAAKNPALGVAEITV